MGHLTRVFINANYKTFGGIINKAHTYLLSSSLLFYNREKHIKQNNNYLLSPDTRQKVINGEKSNQTTIFFMQRQGFVLIIINYLN